MHNTQIADCSVSVENIWSSYNLFSFYEEVLQARYFPSFPPPLIPLLSLNSVRFLLPDHYIMYN